MTDAKVESDPDIKPESDLNSKADANSDPKAGANPVPGADPDASPATATPWHSDMAHDQFTNSLVAFHAERGSGLRLHIYQSKRLTAFNLGRN